MSKISIQNQPQKMVKGVCLLLLISPSIYTISRQCLMDRTKMSMSMEISDWIKRKGQYSRSLNISVSSSSAMWIILLRKMSLRLLDRWSKFGRMNGLNPSINFNGIGIPFWKWSIILQIQIYSVLHASIDQWFSTIWEEKLQFKRSLFPTNQCVFLSIL